MIKFSFKKINIEAPFPTKQIGHLCQTYLVDEFKDHLYGRVFAFRNEKNWIIYLSLDLLAFPLEYRNRLQEKLRLKLDTDLNLITSATHNHYGHDITDEHYISWVIETLANGICAMEYTEVGQVSCSYQLVKYDQICKSRITGYETGNEYLGLIRFFNAKECLLTWIICNCHPTTLAADSHYFSSEYPGYVLKKLEENYPGNYTFGLSACGDISTRFTRDGQSYHDMEKLAEKLYLKIEEQLKQESPRAQLTLDYSEQQMPLKYQHEPIALTNLPADLSSRELETIKIGIDVRKELKEKKTFLGMALTDQVLASWQLGAVKLIFFPNEIFSAYLNELDLEKEYLLSYSNGYGPYVLPLEFKGITYEMFVDGTTRETKEKIVNLLKENKNRNQ